MTNMSEIHKEPWQIFLKFTKKHVKYVLNSQTTVANMSEIHKQPINFIGESNSISSVTVYYTIIFSKGFGDDKKLFIDAILIPMKTVA